MRPFLYAITAAWVASRTTNGTLLFGTVSFNEPSALMLDGTSVTLVFSGGAGAAWERRTTIALIGFTNLSFAVRLRADRSALDGPITVSGAVGCRQSDRHRCTFSVTARPMLAAPLSRETEFPIELNILVLRLHARAASSQTRVPRPPACLPLAWACYPLSENGSILGSAPQMLQSPSQLAALNHDSSDKSLRHVPPAPFISIFVGAALMSIASLGCIARLLRVIFSSQASRRTLGVPTVALAPPPLEQAAAPGGYLSATAGFDSATYLLEAGDAGVQLVVRPNRHGLATLLDALEESLRTHRVCKASLVGE